MIPRRRTPIDALAFGRAGLHSGAAIADFETDVAAATGCAHAVAACSGRTALLGILAASGLQPGDEVVLPALTLRDLPELLQRQGYVPIFADVDAETMLIDAQSVRRVLSARTRAILPTDLFGNTLNWRHLLGVDAKAAGAALIEDAAHAAGSLLDGQWVGQWADAAFFSLETIKMLHAFGGGVAITSDPELAERIRAHLPRVPAPTTRLAAKFLRNTMENVGFRTPAYRLALAALDRPAVREVLLGAYERVRQGGVTTTSAWTDWQARFACDQLQRLAGRVERQRRQARRMMNGLKGLMAFQREPAGVASNRYFLVGTTEMAPPVLRRALLRDGVDIGIGSEIVDFCPTESDAALYPNAHALSVGLVQLPLYPDLSDADANHVVAAVARVLRRGNKP